MLEQTINDAATSASDTEKPEGRHVNCEEMLEGTDFTQSRGEAEFAEVIPLLEYVFVFTNWVK